MTAEQATSSRNVVWATVFLTCVELFGIAMVVFLDVGHPGIFQSVGLALVVGIAPALVTVPMLLGASEPSLGQVSIGRVLIWLQSIALVVAVVLAVIAIL